MSYSWRQRIDSSSMASKHWMRKPGEVYFPSFAGAGGVLPILLASERLDHFVDAALYQRIRVVYPEFVVSDTLVTMLHRLEHERSGWNELEYKNWLPLALEDVAVCLERYLPRQLRSGDQSSDLWTRAAFQQGLRGACATEPALRPDQHRTGSCRGEPRPTPLRSAALPTRTLCGILHSTLLRKGQYSIAKARSTLPATCARPASMGTGVPGQNAHLAIIQSYNVTILAALAFLR
jgi:hypothetical protein